MPLKSLSIKQYVKNERPKATSSYLKSAKPYFSMEVPGGKHDSGGKHDTRTTLSIFPPMYEAQLQRILEKYDTYTDTMDYLKAVGDML